MSKSLDRLKQAVDECKLLDIQVVKNLPNVNEADKGTIYLVQREEEDIVFYDEFILANYNDGFVLIDSLEVTGEEQ